MASVPYDKAQVEALIRAEAAKRNIDPDTAVRVAYSEGMNDYVGDKGSSFGPFQLHYGGVAGGGNAVGGMGDDFTKTTGLHASDPNTVPQQIQFALDGAAKNGWGAWHGAQRINVGNFEGIGNNAKPTGLLSSAPASVPMPPDRPAGLLNGSPTLSASATPDPTAAGPAVGLLGAAASGGVAPQLTQKQQGFDQIQQAMSKPVQFDPVPQVQDPGIQRLMQQKQMAMQAAQKYLPPPPGMTGLLG